MPTVTIDGTEHSVELGSITFEEGVKVFENGAFEQQYVPRTLIEGNDAQYVSKSSFESRFQNWINRDDAVTDEQIVAQIVASNAEAFKVKDLEEAKKTWATAELTPLQKENKKLQTRLDTFESQVIDSAIEAAAGKVWKEPFATAPPGKKSWAQINFRSEAAWDAKYGYVIATEVNSEGKRVPKAAVTPTNARPHMSIEEYLRLQASTDAYSSYARPADRITTGDGAAPRGKAGDSTTIDKSDAQAVAKWWRQQESQGLSEADIEQKFYSLSSAP